MSRGVDYSTAPKLRTRTTNGNNTHRPSAASAAKPLLAFSVALLLLLLRLGDTNNAAAFVAAPIVSSPPARWSSRLSVSADRRTDRPNRRSGRGDGGRGGRRRRQQQRTQRRGDDDQSGWYDDDYDYDSPGGGSRGGRRDGAAVAVADAAIVVPADLNAERLAGSIGCEHFGKGCPGCVVDANVGETDVVRSARLYFASAPVRKHRLVDPDLDEAGRGGRAAAAGDVDDFVEDDGFYRVVVPSPLGRWRTQAKLAVSNKSSWGRDGCRFGLYERGTHDVLPIPNCAVHHPSINRAVEVLTRATEEVGTAAYNEDSGEGGLRYVQMQVERSTGRVCLTLVWNAERLKDAQPGLSRLVKAVKRIEPKLFHSVWCHCNDGAGNAIFARGSGRWHPVDGPEFMREPIPGTDPESGTRRKDGLLYFTPAAFRQGNLDGFDVIARHVAGAVPGGSRVCELYAGVGVLGLTALSYRAREAEAARSRVEDQQWYDEEDEGAENGKEPLVWLRCSDENPNNPRCFSRAVGSMPTEVTGKPPRGRKSKKGRSRGRSGRGQSMEIVGEEGMTLQELMASMERANGQQGGTNVKGPAGAKVTYMVASAAEALHKGQALGADVLIVDPPRKGLEEEVLIQLSKPHNPNQDYTEDPTYLNAPRHTINWTNDVRKIVYVSCGFDALARDCDRLLTGGGGWKLASATGYVLFPGSNHVETVAIFKR